MNRHLFVAILVSMAVVANAQSSLDKLNRPVASFDGSPVLARTALSQAFGSAGVSAGIELEESCTSPFVKVLPPESSSALDATKLVLAVLPDMVLEVTSKGIVSVHPGAVKPGILEVEIQTFTISNSNNLALAVSQLLQLDEVQARMRELKVQQAPGPLGFISIPRIVFTEVATPLTFAHVTVRGVLNSLAAKAAGTVWVYALNSCHEIPQLSLTFDYHAFSRQDHQGTAKEN